jgi:hypothetical protein
MPLLTELIVFILCSYKDFAPTELIIRSGRDLAEVFQQPARLPPSIHTAGLGRITGDKASTLSQMERAEPPSS